MMRAGFDWITPSTALALGLAGAVTIFGATEGVPGRGNLHESQLAWLALGLIAFAVAAAVDYHAWADLAPFLYGLAPASLAAALVLPPRIASTRSPAAPGP